MNGLQLLKSALVGGASVLTLASPATAKVFDIPDGDLATALVAYMKQSNVEIIYADDAVRGHRSHGAHGDYTETAALTQLLRGTGFTTQAMPMTNAIGIVPQKEKPAEQVAQVARRAPAAPAAAIPSAVETVVVTAQKKSENIQNVPIAVTALSQQQLTERQIAGGPDLVKEVPNLTFSKTNFTGYNIQIRGIGTQAISVTTDPAVAVAFNGIPFIRNHFFEQEFYDLDNVEVLRGPQGTLYGRNATAGVVNVVSAKPTDQFEAMLSSDLGNYNNRRFEEMVNIPIVSDKLDLRISSEWTKRDGYTFDESLGRSVDGRDLWSGRMSLAWKPADHVQVEVVWEHFQEDDDRVRSAKQLCKKDPGPDFVDGFDVNSLGSFDGPFVKGMLTQGCLPTSMYSSQAFETPNGEAIPFVLYGQFVLSVGNNATGGVLNPIDPYANQTQPQNLRVIQSLIAPHYRAKNDTLELNVDYAITPALTLTSQTGYNKDFLYSTEDFNRFDTASGLFSEGFETVGNGNLKVFPAPGGIYCDPQLGCSSAMVGEDVSQANSWQLSQEVRLTSSFDGPLNFSFGANYLHYHTLEDYYVMFNVLTALEQLTNGQSAGNYTVCNSDVPGSIAPFTISPNPFFANIGSQTTLPSVFGCGFVNSFGGGRAGKVGSTYIDPNPLGQINGLGHNYFRSENPYDLNSYAGFGEAYYQATPDLKFTGGLRWTDDQKIFWNYPSWVFLMGGGYPLQSIVKQGWDQWTGRFVADWTPKLDFTDQTLIYGSYSRGYKGGGANPPGPEATVFSAQSSVTHPATFKPEFVNAFELGTKNSVFNGAMTLNGDVFYYDYTGYQISQIVDRTSVNLNFNAKIGGAELESTWEPLPGLRFNFAGGWEDTSVDKGETAIDLMDRTAGNPNWMVVKPYVTDTSNCILPVSAVRQIIETDPTANAFGAGLLGACNAAYQPGLGLTGVGNGDDLAAFASVGFNPATAPNNGDGFAKNLGGNKLPNTPPFTLSMGGQYTLPVGSDWFATLRADFYWQGNSYARIFNDKPYDSIHGYSTLNVALMLDSGDGWDIMAYVKNVFDVTAITGAFLNSDDTALTTNVFLTDPRLFGVRLTKRFGEDGGDSDDLESFFKRELGGLPPLWIELDGQWAGQETGASQFLPAFLGASPFGSLPRSPETAHSVWDQGVSIAMDVPDSDWVVSAAVRYGKASRHEARNQLTHHVTQPSGVFYTAYQDFSTRSAETHAIVDFQAGKDVGLGQFWGGGNSVLSAGLRYAAFDEKSGATVVSQPTNVVATHDRFYESLSTTRKFTGFGPSLSWKASANLGGNGAGSLLSLDWGVNGAALFGRQKTRVHHQVTDKAHFFSSAINQRETAIAYKTSASLSRNRGVVVPNLGGFAGISWHYADAKVSLGYRADFFFGAIDSGMDTYKSETRGFFGPYASVSIGLGG